MLYKLTLISLCCALAACSAGSSAAGPAAVCPASAPLFNTELATQLINSWGNNALYYSPSGDGGYTDVYVGAAYFTAAEYAANAVLLPTVKPNTRSGSQQIYNYFTGFLAHSPVMTNNPGFPESGGPYPTLSGCGYGVISGYYNFSYLDGNESTNARYTFQFEYQSAPQSITISIESGPDRGSLLTINQPAGWYIMLQHSSKLPSSFGLPDNLLLK